MPTELNNQDEKETSLRSQMVEKPKNARILSKLSSLLTERSKASNCKKDVSESMRGEAILLARRAIEIAPKRPFGHVALSLCARDFQERMESLVLGIKLSNEFHLARLGLLVRLLLEPRDEESRSLKGKVGKGSQHHPNRRDLNEEEVDIYKRICNDISSCRRSQEQNKYNGDELEFLCKQEYRLGQFFRKKMPSKVHIPRARNHFQQCRCFKLNPHYEMAGFWMATLPSTVLSAGESHPTIEKCPADYIVRLYSTFAPHFDALLLQKLDYQTPTKLRQLVNTALQKDRRQRFLRGCDLGCGTGLSGLAFKDLVDCLVGIDLSREMLERAKVRGCYRNLIVGDVATVLVEQLRRSQLKKFDLVFACDVFCYIGELADIFAAVTDSTDLGGYFCFSTELLEPDDADGMPFKLQPCARFSHKADYVVGLAKEKGFECLQLEVSTLRKNQGKCVRGVLAVLRKISS